MNTNKVKKIIKLSTTWCGPCRAFGSTFHRVSEMEEYKDIEFKEIDIENDEDGEPIYKVMGNIPEKDFITIINESLKDR